MLNFQVTDYVANNELICFGMSAHEITEWVPEWTPKAKKDLDILASWFPRSKIDEIITRPSEKSDFNWTNYATKAQVRCLLGLAVIRELPIKNFYVRCWITWAYLVFFVSRGIGRGLRYQRPIVFYNQRFHERALLNYPDLYWWNICRVLPRNPPVPDAHREWRTRQTPVFHQYHKVVYRYRMRKPRYVPWDGSMNQPVMPYLIDQGTDVINGTFKRNSNSTPQLK